MIQRITLLLVLSVSLMTFGGCKKLKLFFGGYIVTEPEKESPEWVVQQVIKASMIEDFDKAFTEYSKWLHSSELDSSAGMTTWETMRFPALRRKHKCYLQTDDGPDAFKVKEVRELREDYIWIGVQCKTTDMPTPCHLFKDDKQGGKWRVKMNCLN